MARLSAAISFFCQFVRKRDAARRRQPAIALIDLVQRIARFVAPAAYDQRLHLRELFRQVRFYAGPAGGQFGGIGLRRIEQCVQRAGERAGIGHHMTGSGHGGVFTSNTHQVRIDCRLAASRMR